MHPASTAPDAALRRAALLVLAGTAIFVAMDALGKELVKHYSTIEIAWARYLFNLAAFVAIVAAGQPMSGILRTRRLGLQLVRALLMLVTTYVFFAALRHLRLAEVTALAFLSPLVMTALSVPLLKERVSPQRWLAVGVGFLGALLIIRPGFGDFHWAMLLALTCAVTRALYMIVTRALGAHDGPFTTLFYSSLIGTALTSLVVPFDWRAPDAVGWAMLAALGLLGAVGHYMLIRAFTLAPSSALAPFGYTEMIWSLLFGLVLFGEFPPTITLIGAAIIAGAGLYSLRTGGRPARKSSEPRRNAIQP